MNIFKEYDKIDNTLCLNSLNLKFNIDDEEHCDCENMEEMVECLDTIRNKLKLLDQYENLYIDVRDFDGDYKRAYEYIISKLQKIHKKQNIKKY